MNHSALLLRGPSRLVLLAVVAVATTAAQAETSSPTDKAQPPEDYDAETERHSRFWERALFPNRELYDRRISDVFRLFKGRSQDRRKVIETLLRDTARLSPTDPRAYWYLSVLKQDDEDWESCAKLRQIAYAHDPNFAPPRKLSREPRDLHLGLALCLIHSGHHERALSLLKRRIKRGKSFPHLHHLIGQAYMALGRLEEATASLKLAASSLRTTAARIGLAVAYDRDEQLSKSRETIQSAVRGYRSFRSPDSFVDVAPAEDRYYYAALVRSHTREPEAAIIYLRHFLHQHGSGPWARRARDHIEHLTPTSMTQLTQRGSTVPQAAADAALHAIVPQLRECMKPAPNVLLRVQLTRHNPPNGSSPSVTVTTQHKFQTDSTVHTGAVQCVARVTRQMTLPLPKSGLSTISFYVISHD